MRVRQTLFTILLIFLVGCGQEIPEGVDATNVASDTQALSVNSAEVLDWANSWILEVKAQPSQLLENLYTASAIGLQRMSTGVKAQNRNVCGTLVTTLLQKSVGFVADDFYKSFNKAMDGTCAVGTIGGQQKGTTSPDASQYRYKIDHCSGTGPIQFTPRSTISAVQSGDVLAVSYPERTDITGHVMIVRSPPIVDNTLPAGPSGSTAYAVGIIDSTSSPHGSAAKYPDWRGGNKGQGLGSGTFVLYADSSGAIVASRWSAMDSTLTPTSTAPLAIGGLR